VLPPPYILGRRKIDKKIFSGRKLFVLGLKILFGANLGAKLKILSAHSLLCRKFAVVYRNSEIRKIANFCSFSIIFFNSRRRWRRLWHFCGRADFLGVLADKIGDRFPASEDLGETVDALFHLQDLYALTPDQVASGLLYGDIEHPVSMTCKMNK